jgi:hypothetical protein
MFLVGEEDAQTPLCLDHYFKLMQAFAIQSDILERQINFAADQIDLAMGIPGLAPKFPERRPVHIGDVTLNNIKIDKSNIGVINTGTIGAVDAAITILKQSGEQSVATAIQKLTEAAISSKEASEEIKQQIVEILSVLATEAATPKEQRRSTIVRRLLVDLATIVNGVAALAQLWQLYGPVIENLFK